MLYLKPMNKEDIDEEYKAITVIPKSENGFENPYHDVSYDEFVNKVVPLLMDHSKGLGLPDGYVPDTWFWLWDDDRIVGLYKIRHYLNDFLKTHAGHMGAAIVPEFRGSGYGTVGLKIAIEKAFSIIPEDELYLAFYKYNTPSLKMQLKNHAYLTEENEDHYLTRIKRNVDDIVFDFRDLRRDDWKRIVEKEVIIDDIKTNDFEGKVSLVKMNKVTDPLFVDSAIGKVKICDNGFTHMMIAPMNANWWLTVMYDENDQLIESYIDITKVNCFDAEVPYFVDMKLDICIPANGEPYLMDEDDLQEVLDKGMITQEDYDNAYKTVNVIIEFYKNHKDEYYKYISELYDRMKTLSNNKSM